MLELDELIAAFFAAVSFGPGKPPDHGRLHELFIDSGLLIRNSQASPKVFTVGEFVAAGRSNHAAGQLTSFAEAELAQVTEIFGNVAQRFSTYEKTGVQAGEPFSVRGMISTQLVNTPDGWRISAMAWDDERPGLTIADGYYPGSTAPATP